MISEFSDTPAITDRNPRAQSQQQEENDLFTDSDNSDEDEDDGLDAAAAEEQRRKRGGGIGLGDYFRKKQKKVVKMLMDYGPPYTKMESGITLLDECALPEPSLFEIHSMLNQRLNPNFRDPEDYYNSPMHWCARHAHYRPMKLLRRAKVDMNPRNEFGHTPLHVICMMVFPEDKRKRQLKTFKWMLEQGAEINFRDKGGYCPIDYASMNGHEAMVALLLERGAEVLRENKIFAASRQPLLHIAVGPVSRRLIQERIDEVVMEKAITKQIEDEEKALEDDILKLKKRHERLGRKRREAITQKHDTATKEYHSQRENEKYQKLYEENERIRLERNTKNVARYGYWKKEEEKGGRWQYQFSDRPVGPNGPILPPSSSLSSSRTGTTAPNSLLSRPKTTSGIPERVEKYQGYQENLSTMRDLKEKYNFQKYNDRWKKKTGNNLEIQWKKEDIFQLPIEERYSPQTDDQKASRSGKRRDEIADTLAVYDENDKELEGENIDDLLSY